MVVLHSWLWSVMGMVMVGSGGYDWLVVGYGCFEGFC